MDAERGGGAGERKRGREHREDELRARTHMRDVETIELADVAALMSQVHAGGLKRESIRNTVSTLAMVLDFIGRTGEHNPARDRLTVKLPREPRDEPKPPTAEQVLAVHSLLPPAYRLPLLVLDATRMRVGELEALTWGDVDEARSRWRVSQAVAKTGKARWVAVPEPLFGAVRELVPRDDRTPERRVFQGVTADRLRTASRGRARRRACLRSRRTTSGTDGSRSCI